MIRRAGQDLGCLERRVWVVVFSWCLRAKLELDSGKLGGRKVMGVGRSCFIVIDQYDSS